MSKGEIVQHLGDGRYRVRQLLAKDRIEQELIKLNEQIAELAIKVPQKKLELLQAESALESTAAQIGALLPSLMAGTEGVRAQITALERELVPQRSQVRQLELAVAELIAQNLAALKRRNQLESVPEAKELEAWCADLTEDLSGEVGLVDVNDEGGRSVIIQPGYGEEAAYSQSRDGALFPDLAQSGPQIFFNAAILPGVQKWMPRYRVGVIESIENDSCTVTLDDAQSSAQGLDINREKTLTAVPIVYMECNGAVFEEGDRVLVRFTANGPLVIGFESEPRPCSVFDFIFTPAQSISALLSNTYGKPFAEPGGAEINAPLGTLGGNMPAWVAQRKGQGYEFERGRSRFYGNWNWIGKNRSEVLSWYGHGSRVCDPRVDERRYVGTGGSMPVRGPYVFFREQIIFDAANEAARPWDVEYVEGAAFHYRNGERYLRVGLSNFARVVEGVTPYNLLIFEYPLDQDTNQLGLGVLLGQYQAPFWQWQPISGLYFSASGEKAVQTLAYGSTLSGDRMLIRLNAGVVSAELTSNARVAGSRVKSPIERTSTPVVDDGRWNNGSSLQTDTWFTPQQVALLYVEMIGDEEREVVLVEPQYDEVRTEGSNFSAEAYTTIAPNGDTVYWSRPTGLTQFWSITEKTEGYRIMAGGELLASLPDSGHSREMSAVNSVSGAADFMGQDRTFNFTYNNAYTTKDISLENIHIDARAGIVASAIFERREVISGAGSGSFGNDYNYDANGVSSNLHHFAVWKSGALVHLEETYRNVDSYGPQTITYTETTGSVMDDWAPGTYEAAVVPYHYLARRSIPTLMAYLGQAPQPIYRPISWASCAGDKSAVAASFVWRRQNDEYGALTLFPNYQNPVSQVLNRDEADLYFFQDISLV